MSDHYENPAPATPATDAWINSHEWTADRPEVVVRFPQWVPEAHVDVIERGCLQPPILRDPDRPMATLHLGSVRFVATLDELERYIDAAREAVAIARWRANELARQMADDNQETQQ